ncbi:helix-turn-helix transcriptional regulator [Streptomyces piniterrae]|uniref:Helix-turn-helix transcriptional regulator n=1 Tax=Streptomyces piniterrae TaxID=2571125 RepID=A0A4U0MWJ8_9ACTN|nr:helix-turn-helix domain-containing protein [Streptomyces piniterrae]TJZ45206.1 helix-turn-helix transcriptional regulator [Streptomyces piniterrae]
MPAARESLLDAAMTALTTRAWAAVRMVDVATAAGVSRQTLYNEFGSKEGLARALVRRETDNYLAGVDRLLAQEGAAAAGPRDDAAGRVVAAAAWTLRTARANPLVRAALTGCWSDRLPAPPVAEPAPVRAARTGVPGQRAESSGERPLPGPAELVGRFCDRAVAALEPGWPEEELPALGAACETAARLTLSCVVAPAGPAAPVPEAEAVSRLVRGAFARLPGGGEAAGDPAAVRASRGVPERRADGS